MLLLENLNNRKNILVRLFKKELRPVYLDNICVSIKKL